MQKFFGASQKPSLIDACRAEIKKAKKNKRPIIFVEFEGFGKTDHRLTDLTEYYDNVFYLKKGEQDGSDKVVSFLRSKRLKRSVLRFCGVNTDQCVFSTVYGLKKKMRNTKMVIVEDGVNSYSDAGHRCGMDWLRPFCDIIKSAKKKKKVTYEPTVVWM
jgi:nicotinamidase-related amidase